jgi:hypothetical protein
LDRARDLVCDFAAFDVARLRLRLGCAEAVSAAVAFRPSFERDPIPTADSIAATALPTACPIAWAASTTIESLAFPVLRVRLATIELLLPNHREAGVDRPVRPKADTTVCAPAALQQERHHQPAADAEAW